MYEIFYTIDGQGQQFATTSYDAARDHLRRVFSASLILVTFSVPGKRSDYWIIQSFWDVVDFCCRH